MEANSGYFVIQNTIIKPEKEVIVDSNEIEFIYNTGLPATDIIRFHVMVELPKIPAKDGIEYSWPGLVGSCIVKSIFIYEIDFPQNGVKIPLFNATSALKSLGYYHCKGLRKMLGDVTHLVSWNSILPDYTLFIPLFEQNDSIQGKLDVNKLISVRCKFVRDLSTLLRVREHGGAEINPVKDMIPLKNPKMFVTYMVKEQKLTSRD